MDADNTVAFYVTRFCIYILFTDDIVVAPTLYLHMDNLNIYCEFNMHPTCKMDFKCSVFLYVYI